MLIQISYIGTRDNPHIINLSKELTEGGLTVEIKRVTPQAMNSVVWIAPALFTAYLTKPFFESFFTEAGKDAWGLLKKGLKKLFHKVQDEAFSYKLTSNKHITLNGLPTTENLRSKLDTAAKELADNGFTVIRNENSQKVLNINIASSFGMIKFPFYQVYDLTVYDEMLTGISDFFESEEYNTFSDAIISAKVEIDKTVSVITDSLNYMLANAFYMKFDTTQKKWVIMSADDNMPLQIPNGK